jgi:hypothetical protein
MLIPPVCYRWPDVIHAGAEHKGVGENIPVERAARMIGVPLQAGEAEF